jgi:hypothetical protein
MIAGALALAYTIYIGTDRSTMTLCPLNPALVSGCQRASPGIGVYLAGVGAFLMIAGGWQIRTSKVEVAAAAPAAIPARSATTVCPDCAETIRAEARVCKHCGYRFSASPCGNCGQSVAAEDPFCGNCGARIRRRYAKKA